MVAVLYFLSFSLGYLSIHYSRIKLDYPFFVRLPVYLSVGLSLLTVVSFFAGLMTITGFTLILISLVAWIIIARWWYLSKRSPLSALRRADNILPLALLAISFTYFSAVAGIMKWPLPGDSIAHGALTSLMLHNGVLRFDLTPLVAMSAYYPPGLHVLTAHVSNLAGLYAAEGVLTTGAAIASVIPLMLYSLAYFFTKSKLLSMISFLSFFLVHMSGNLEMWAMGYFFNGSYPSLFGFLNTLTVLVLISGREFRFDRYSLPVLGVFLFQISITYPSLVLVIAPFMFVLLVWRRRETIQEALKSRWVAALAGAGLFVIILLGFFAFQFVYPGFSLILQSGHSPYYSIQLDFFLDLIGIMVLAAGVLSTYLIVKKSQAYVATFYIFTLGLCLLSLVGAAYNYVWYVLPTRLIVINILLSGVVLSSTLHVVREKMRKNPLNNKYTDVRAVAVLLAVVLLIPFFSYSASLKLARNFSWYSGSLAFASDREVSVWIDLNVPWNETILNDLSWSGFYLLSYSYKTVVIHYFSSIEDNPKLAEARRFWLRASDKTLARKVLSELNIKYVFTTAETGYYDRTNFGGDGSYKMKPFSPARYIRIFDSYFFLRKVFQRGDSAVYEVIL